MEAAGIEPASNSDASDNAPCGCDNCGEACAARALHSSDTSGQRLSFVGTTGHCECAAELQSIAQAWPQLPEHVRASILLLVQAAVSE